MNKVYKKEVIEKYVKIYESYPIITGRQVYDAGGDYMDNYALYRRTFLIGEEAHNSLRTKILSCAPFSAVRMGCTESNIVGEYIERKVDLRREYSKCWIDALLKSSGFFHSHKNDLVDEIDMFAELQLKCLENCDILMVWFAKYNDFFAGECVKKGTDIVLYRSIRPFKKNFEPWTAALRDKKVLVVTSFPESVRLQYARKDKIARWKISELPDFELMTYGMINTMNGHNNGFRTWFDAYRKIKEDVLAIDFDIALIGAGAYGVPLSQAIKESGRQAIELCGYTPVIFGVCGQRHVDQGFWDEYGTEYWMRPIEERPNYYNEIEGGCYW